MTEKKDKEKERRSVNKTWKNRLQGHKDAICFLTSPGEDLLLSISADASLRMYDLQKKTGGRPLQLTAPKPDAPELGYASASARTAARKAQSDFPGLCTAFAYRAAPDAAAHATVFGGYECGRVAAWDGEDGELIGNFNGHTGVVSALQIRREELFSASLDGTIRVWSLEADRLLAAACVHILDVGSMNPVADCVLLSNDRLVAASWDGNLRCLDLRTQVCSSMFEVSATAGLRALCSCEEFNGDVSLYVGTEDCQIACWKLPCIGEAQEVRAWKAHDQEVTVLRHSGERLFSGSEDRTVRVWCVRGSECGSFLDEMRGHDGAILVLCITEKLIWSGSRDTSLRSWDVMEMQLRIWERSEMRKADLLSHQIEKFNSLTGGGKKKNNKKAANQKKANRRGKSR